MFSQLIGNGSVATFGMVLLHTLWQGALICVVTALLLEWRRNAGATFRYATYCIALLLLVTATIATFVWSIPSARPTTATYAFSSADSDEMFASEPAQDDLAARPTTAVLFKTPLVVEGNTTVFSLKHLLNFLASWVAIAWLVVVPILLIRLLANYTNVRMVHLRHTTPALDSMQEIARSLCERMRYHRTVRLLVSTRVIVPMVIGWVKPVVLLPAAFLTNVSTEQFEALLAHELAHLRRLDPLVNFLQCIAETVLFFNPSAWWLSRRIRIEREYCCDDLALAMGMDPTLYAESLLAVAETAINTPVYAMSSGGGMLLTRIKRVLGMNTGPRARIKSGLFGAAIVVALILGVCTTYVLAQNRNPVLAENQETVVAENQNPVDGTVQESETANVQDPATAEEQNPTPTEKEQGVAYLLEFPADRSLGEVSFQKAGVDSSDTRWDKGSGWSKVGPAQGTVEVPDGIEVSLSFSGRDMSMISSLPPDCIVKFECTAKDLIDDDIKPLLSLTNLRSLALNGSKGITDLSLEILKPLQHLENLQIKETSIQKLTGIANFKKLNDIDLASSLVGDEGIANLAAANLPNLKVLGIGGISITEQGFASVAKIKTVKKLLLGPMELGDSWIKYLADASAVEFLSAKKCNINDNDLAAMQNMRSLRILKIPYNQVTDAGMEYVAAMPALEEFITYGNAITANCLPILGTSKTLWEIAASNTDIPYGTLKTWRIKNNFKRKTLPVASAPQKSTNPQALKVGVVFSDFAATGPHWMPSPYRYQMDGYSCREIVRLLSEANVDLYAVIDPGTAELGELPDILASTGLSNKTIDSTNPTDLLKLDVVCSWSFANVLPETLNALRISVKQGLGYFCTGAIGSVTPEGNDPALMDLLGHSSQEYTWFAKEGTSFEVVNAHPILGELKPGTKMNGILFNGMFDPNRLPQGTILIGSTATSSLPTFCPMYLREYGKGKMVFNVFWNLGIGDIPPETFYMRCVNWAAGRPVDTKY